MKVCTCFLFCGIFAYTNSKAWNRAKADRSVAHEPLETVAQYSNEEYSGDTSDLDNVHNFQTRGTTLSNRNIKIVSRSPRIDTLTDFIQKAVHILNTYEDTAFEDFFHVLDNEIRKYHYSGCKFSELTQNSDTRSLLAGSLKLIRGKPVSFTKANINEVANMLRDETYDKHVKELLDYINSLYTHTELNFHSVLNELKYYRNTKTVRTHNNLVQVIRGGVRAILFDPYTELNTHTRRELKGRIETFWKQFKSNRASSAEMNDIPYRDPVIKSGLYSQENKMNEVNNPEPYSKNDPLVKSKNKREKSVSIETYKEEFQDDETEKDESSNESGKQVTNYNTDENSSGQSFDSSSNSIKNSQERHVEYNTQRYMTLYTEEISYKPKTTKKTEIVPISANVRGLESGLTLESKHEPRASETRDKPQKQGKADQSRTKSKHNVEIISQHDAVIDVQLANTELLKSLGMFVPLETDTKYDATLSRKSAKQIETVPIQSTIRPGSMRAEAEIQARIPSALTKSPSIYSKRNNFFFRKELSDIRKNIAPPLFNGGKNEHQNYRKSSDNNTVEGEDFNTYLIKRINAMENELKELKQMNTFNFRSTMNENNIDAVEARNVTDKTEPLDKVDSKIKDIRKAIMISSNKNHDLNNKEVNDRQEFIINTKSSSKSTLALFKTFSIPKVIKKDAINATVIHNKIITQVTNNISKINANVTKKLSKGVINNNVTTSTVSLYNITKHESVVTTPTIGMPRRTMAHSVPSYSYYDSQENRPTVRNRQIGTFFEHVNDGIDLHM